MHPGDMSACEIAGAVARGDISAFECTQAALSRIDRLNGSINAFLHIDAEGAIASARSIDSRRARGESLGPLAGVPIAI